MTTTEEVQLNDVPANGKQTKAKIASNKSTRTSRRLVARDFRLGLLTVGWHIKAKIASNKSTRTSRPKGARGRRRGPKAYVVMTLAEALTIGRGIVEHAAGHPMKRLTLLEKLKLADNDATLNLITNSGKYGITQGYYQAEVIRLTETDA